MYTLRKEDFNTKTMVKIAVLGVIAFVLMLLDFPLWFTPPFLKFDVSDNWFLRLRAYGRSYSPIG